MRHSLWQTGVSVWSCRNELRIFCCYVFLSLWNWALEVPQKKGGKRNLCGGKISSTCLRWKLVDLKRWRGAGRKGESAGDGREKDRALSLVLFFEKKNKKAGDHTRKPGDARMSINPVLIGSWLKMFQILANERLLWCYLTSAHMKEKFLKTVFRLSYGQLVYTLSELCWRAFLISSLT